MHTSIQVFQINETKFFFTMTKGADYYDSSTEGRYYETRKEAVDAGVEISKGFISIDS